LGSELVTGSDSQAATGGGNRRLPVVYRYGETFEKLCGYYMSLGMGYHDYWDGDCEMARYYRDMDEKVKSGRMKPSGYKVCISMKRWLTLPRY
jgi:hypothetical protein